MSFRGETPVLTAHFPSVAFYLAYVPNLGASATALGRLGVAWSSESCLILGLWRYRQADQEFKASLWYTASLKTSLVSKRKS